MSEVKLAVIGGSGVYDMEALTNIEERHVSTPFGEPSDTITIGTLSGKRIAFLPRHGRVHQHTPTEVPYRANIWALKSLGVERIIYTDISRDGMMTGPNVAATRELAQQSELKVIASGGISSLEDVQKIAALEPYGVDAMIIGKALYEGAINLKEALTLIRTDAGE